MADDFSLNRHAQQTTQQQAKKFENSKNLPATTSASLDTIKKVAPNGTQDHLEKDSLVNKKQTLLVDFKQQKEKLSLDVADFVQTTFLFLQQDPQSGQSLEARWQTVSRLYRQAQLLDAHTVTQSHSYTVTQLHRAR